MQFHTFFGINFIKSSYQECVCEIESRLLKKNKTLIVTPNPEILYDAHSDSELFTILKQADIALPDGAWLFVGYQIQDSKLPLWIQYIMLPFWCLRAIIHSKHLTQQYWERITGSRITADILSLATKHGIGVTIIDPVVYGNSAWDNLKRSSQKNIQTTIKSLYPGIHCEIIFADSADGINPLPIIVTTHGNKIQEKIANSLLRDTPTALLAIGIGSSIDLLTGFRQPAPAFFRRYGGEWAYRMYKNPKKHAKRMMRVWSFLWLCLKH